MKSILTIMCVVVATIASAQSKSQKDSLYKRNYDESHLYIFQKDPHLKPFMELKVYVGYDLYDGLLVKNTVYLIGVTPEKIVMDTAICGVKEIAIDSMLYAQIQHTKKYRSILNLFIDSNGVLQLVIINWQPAWNAYSNWSYKMIQKNSQSVQLVKSN